MANIAYGVTTGAAISNQSYRFFAFDENSWNKETP